MKTCQPEYLVVTNKRDITSDFIVREMKLRSHAFLRLNTEDIPKWSFSQTTDSLSSNLQNQTHSFNMQGIRAAYFRRPETPDTYISDIKKNVIHYRQSEWNYILKSIYLELGNKWFSHPNNIILAENKPEQLRLAKGLGFNVPETVITNDIKKLPKLFKKGEVVAKPINHALIDGGDIGDGGVIFTNTISKLSDIGEEALSLAPVIFQRKIHKEYDIRATVVGDRVFATAIDSQQFKATQTDWRHTDIERLPHKSIKLQENDVRLCIALVKKMGLRYGAIDLVKDTQGVIWFLECNPNGQWAWIQNRTGVNIAGAIVDIMETIS